MWAMIVKEFRQLRRDRLTLAMMIVMPVILLIVFGYAASFDVSTISTVVAGPQAAAAALRAPFDVVQRAPAEGASWARAELRDGRAAVAVVTGTPGRGVHRRQPAVHRAAALTALANMQRRLARKGSRTGAPARRARRRPEVTVLYNPGSRRRTS